MEKPPPRLFSGAASHMDAETKVDLFVTSGYAKLSSFAVSRKDSSPSVIWSSALRQPHPSIRDWRRWAKFVRDASSGRMPHDTADALARGIVRGCRELAEPGDWVAHPFLAGVPICLCCAGVNRFPGSSLGSPRPLTGQHIFASSLSRAAFRAPARRGQNSARRPHHDCPERDTEGSRFGAASSSICVFTPRRRCASYFGHWFRALLSA